MRLLTHNFLKSPVLETAESSLPLELHAEDIDVRESPFREDFIRHILPQLDWSLLRTGARAVGLDTLPECITEQHREDVEFLKAVHQILMDVHVVEGHLKCQHTDKIFQIVDGIPHLRFDQDETVKKLESGRDDQEDMDEDVIESDQKTDNARPKNEGTMGVDTTKGNNTVELSDDDDL